jgi:hypothetical protein
MNNKKKDFSKLSDLLRKVDLEDLEEDKYVSREFQQYGYDLAEELGDLKHKALYIKLAKETPRGFLETARNFVKDAYNVKSKARLFMWKLSELKKEKKAKGKK